MAPRPSGPHLAQRLRTLCLSCPPVSALFYARLYRALFPPTDTEHDSLHILALCLLQSDQAYPALHVVRDLADADADPKDDIPDYENGIPARRPGCYGCAVIVAKCCDKLKRYSEGQQVLGRAIRRSLHMSRSTRFGLLTCADTLSPPHSVTLGYGSDRQSPACIALAQGQGACPGRRPLPTGAGTGPVALGGIHGSV